MADFGRLTLSRLLAVGVLVLAGYSRAQTPPPVAEQIADAYGLKSFEQVEAIRYTFKLAGPALNISRSWVWQPKTGHISYEGKDKEGKPVKVTFFQSEVTAESDVAKGKIDWFFVNDNYWLVFPFHVYWDAPGADVQAMDTKTLPLGKGSAKLVTVAYSKSGYTPGDTWDLYVGSDNRIKELVYHRGDPKSPVPGVLKVTWEGYKKAGPILFSTEHRGTADGKPIHLSLSKVAVKLEGSDTWIEAH